MSHRRRARIGSVIAAKTLIEESLGLSLDEQRGLRRSLTAEDEEELVAAVVAGKQASFGIVKLKDLDLSRPLAESRTTLIRLSSSLRRDAITASLLRAGADPSIRGDEDEVDKQLMKHFWSLPPAYAVHLINIANSPATTAGRCDQCLSEAESVVRLPGECTHELCSPCFFHSIVLRSDCVSAPARCSVRDCGCIVEGVDLLRLPFESDLERVARWIEERLRVDPASLSIVAEQSLERFLALPKDGEPKQQQQQQHSRLAAKRFCALSFRAVQRSRLGNKQEKRTDQLFAAAAAGNVTRLVFLLAAGVDLEAVNDYRQTALFVACWKGHKRAARLLALAGSDPRAKDSMGVCPAHLLPSVFGVDADPPPVPSLPTVLRPVAQMGPLVTLLPVDANHAGAGSFYVDDLFDDEFLDYLSGLPDTRLPVSPAEKASCSDRYYWCDTEGVLVRAVASALAVIKQRDKDVGLTVSGVLPGVRFLAYRNVGGALPPHIDLCRTETTFSFEAGEAEGEVVAVPTRTTSTHTFILYLTTCASGGETALLRALVPRGGPSASPGEEESNLIAAVQPVRGRLLFFRHACPHEGRVVECVPKLLVRGEMF